MKKKSNILFFTVLTILVLLFCFAPGVRSKAKSLFTGSSAGTSSWLEDISHKFKNNFSFLTNIGNLKKQNEELGQKIVSLQVDSSQIEELKNENALLKKELGFISAENKNSLIPAKVIERDPIAFLDHIVIDKGTNDGIENNMTVISSGALVGQVKEALDHTSTVILITSKDSIIQAMLQNSRSKGILRGGISGLYIDDITLDTSYKIGENIVTSGLGGEILPGILIGTAGKLESSSSSIFKMISVEPVIDISSLELVFVQK